MIPPREAETGLLALLDSGESLLREERAAFLGGRFDLMGDIAARKQALLAELEARVPRALPTARLRRALESLVAQSRQTERIILAARSGLRAARRRIEAIEATRRGDVAYAADGSRIVSHADRAQQNRRA